MTSTLSRLTTIESRRRGAGSGTNMASGIDLLPIAADLLPRQAAATRNGRSGRLVALALVLVAVVGVGAWYLFAAHATSSAQTRLQAAQDRQTSLQAQQRRYADLTTTIATSTALRGQLATLMASDLPWSELLPALGGIRGVITFTTVSGTLTDPAAAATGAGAPVDTGAIGTLTITGQAADKPTVAAFVDALGATHGLANPFVASVTQGTDGGGFTFSVSVDITKDIRAAAPSRWATTTGGGK